MRANMVDVSKKYINMNIYVFIYKNKRMKPVEMVLGSMGQGNEGE
jgi:hypothetical protein